jgi:hypothetical protein
MVPRDERDRDIGEHIVGVCDPGGYGRGNVLFRDGWQRCGGLRASFGVNHGEDGDGDIVRWDVVGVGD